MSRLILCVQSLLGLLLLLLSFHPTLSGTSVPTESESTTTSDDQAVCTVEINSDGSSSSESCGSPSIASSIQTPAGQPRRGHVRRDPAGQQNSHSQAMGVKFKNPRRYQLDYWWIPPGDRGGGEVYQGIVDKRGVTATNSYLGHTFSFTKRGVGAGEEFFRITVVEGKNLYLIPCPTDEEPSDNADDGCSKTSFYTSALEEINFMDEYMTENGFPWLAHYKRDPPILHMWPADEIGQVHKIHTKQLYWVCPNQDGQVGTGDQRCLSLNPFLNRTNPDDMDSTPDYDQSITADTELELELEVIETHPRVFRVNSVISDVEADAIINIAQPRIKRSLAGNHGGLVSNTRTSKNTWLGRSKHKVLDTLYRRAADILNVSEALLWPDKNVEELQVVNYQIGQEYTPHHDFGAEGVPNQRIITLLLYLNDMKEGQGGETAFPKAKHGQLVAHPGKGNGILFYSLLEDGNADDLSLHAALPVIEGEKWLANFWVWDPKR